MESGTDGAIINREKARIRPEYPGSGAPITEQPVLVRGPLKGLLGKALKCINTELKGKYEKIRREKSALPSTPLHKGPLFNPHFVKQR